MMIFQDFFICHPLSMNYKMIKHLKELNIYMLNLTLNIQKFSFKSMVITKMSVNMLTFKLSYTLVLK
jgi:hypothetical protein